MSSLFRGRRRALKAVGTTLAAAVVVPRAAAGSGQGQHAAHGQTATAAPPAAGAAPALPGVLDEHERATLAVLGEQLVPGSTAAGVPGLVDRVLAAEPREELRRFRNALGAFEREARSRHSRTWLAAGEAERAEILRDAAAAAPAVPPRAGWRPGEPVLPARAPGPPPAPTLRDHLDYLRDTVARAYYATEPGLKELGWDGNEIFEGLPVCPSPGR